MLEVRYGHVVGKPYLYTRIINKAEVCSLYTPSPLHDEESPLCNRIDLKHADMHLHAEHVCVTPVSHGTVPSNSRSAILPRCQKEDSPRLVLSSLSQQSRDGALWILSIFISKGRALTVDGQVFAHE